MKIPATRGGVLKMAPHGWTPKVRSDPENGGFTTVKHLAHTRPATTTTTLIVLVSGCLLSLATFSDASSAQMKPAAVDPAAGNPTSKVVPSESWTLDVNYVAGKLSVQADQADLRQLLKKISEATGIPIEVGAGISARVGVSFTGLPLETGINRILESAGEKNLTSEYAQKPGTDQEEYRLGKITIVRK